MALYNKINKEELKAQAAKHPEQRTTLSFYRYFEIEDVSLFRDNLYEQLKALDVFGRIYVASEGINGQISLPTTNLDKLRAYFQESQHFRDMRLNIAIEDAALSFYVLKIKIRKKIVADGLPPDSVDLTAGAPHIDADTFNTLTEAESTVVIDMRNHYESEVGHFSDAICPDVATFRESLPIVEDILEQNKGKDVIMYCTGGIRCEKASAYFRQRGFDKIHQLNGGIIEYARQVKEAGLENKFQGKNFVFDERLGERISENIIAQCHQCGAPCDTHQNCANDACHLLFIQCQNCAEKYRDCCSEKCADFNQLPAEEKKERRKLLQFNGSKFGKGRYKAHHHGNILDQD